MNSVNLIEKHSDPLNKNCNFIPSKISIDIIISENLNISLPYNLKILSYNYYLKLVILINFN